MRFQHPGHVCPPRAPPVLGPRTPLGPLWDTVLGPLAAPLAAIVDEAEDPALIGQAAVVFADQDKAFERMSWAWLCSVLRGWGLPPWLCGAFLGLFMFRVVRTMVLGFLGPPRTLRRSLGMGGTASPLGWNIGYDPGRLCDRTGPLPLRL